MYLCKCSLIFFLHHIYTAQTVKLPNVLISTPMAMKLFETFRRREKAGTLIKAAVARCWQRGRGVRSAPLVFVLGWGPAGFLSPDTERAAPTRSAGSSPGTAASLGNGERFQEPRSALRQLRLGKSGSGGPGDCSCSWVVSPTFVTCGSRGGESFTLSMFRNSPVRLLRRNQVVWMTWKLSRESLFLLMQL